MPDIKKLSAVLVLSAALLTGCATDTSEPESVPADTTTAATTSTPEQTTTEATTTTAETTAAPEVIEPEEPEFFTTPANDTITSLGCLTYEGATGAWAHLVNPYNAQALYSPLSSSDFPSDTDKIIICFDVTGVTSEITAFCGLLAYGIGDEDEEMQVWSQDTYKALTGEEFEFVITEDGYYEMEVPLTKIGDGLEYWEGLDYVSIIEVAFYGAEATNEAGEYLEALTDGLNIEFHGIKAAKAE